MTARPESPEPQRLRELRGLISAVCDGEPTSSQAARFEKLVCDDPACAAYYVKAMQVFALLPRHFGARLDGAAALIDQWQQREAAFWDDTLPVAPHCNSSDESPAVHKIEPSASFSGQRRTSPLVLLGKVASHVHASSVLMVLLIATLIYGSFGLVVWQMSRFQRTEYADNEFAQGEPSLSPPADGEPVARLVSSTGCRWEIDSTVGGDKQPLRPGLLHLAAGSAVLEFNKGARVTLEGPSRFQLVSSNSGFLDSGKLLAQVPKQAIGFEIATPSAKVIDMGTEFGVEVDRTGVAEVHVFQGLVVAEYGGGSGGTVPRRMELRKSEAARFTGRIANASAEKSSTLDSQKANVVSIPINHERYANLIEKPKPAVVITSAEPNNGKQYRVIPHGLHEDALAYFDRAYQWNGVDATGLPPELVGADYVETSNSDDLDPDFELKITLAVPATLYVFFDSRVESVPDWLERDFVNTGLSIGMDDDFNTPLFNGAGNSIDVRFSVWKRRVGAGVVALGPTDRKGVGHYGVAATADANEK